jgi:hypothetical protein
MADRIEIPPLTYIDADIFLIVNRTRLNRHHRLTHNAARASPLTEGDPTRKPACNADDEAGATH